MPRHSTLTWLLLAAAVGTGYWMAGWLSLSIAMAGVAGWVLVWRAGSRQARVALHYRTTPLHPAIPASHDPGLFPPISGDGDRVWELAPTAYEPAPVSGIEYGTRRAAVSRVAARRPVDRRPIAGRRREHLRRWVQR